MARPDRAAGASCPHTFRPLSTRFFSQLYRLFPTESLPAFRSFRVFVRSLCRSQRFAWQTVSESLLDLRGSQARGCVPFSVAFSSLFAYVWPCSALSGRFSVAFPSLFGLAFGSSSVHVVSRRSLGSSLAKSGDRSPRAGRKAEDVATLAEYRSNLEDEIHTTCARCLATLQTLLAGGGVSDESGMFYRQMVRLCSLFSRFLLIPGSSLAHYSLGLLMRILAHFSLISC